MKKLLLFTFALFLWTGAWADSKTVYFNPTSNWDKDGAVFAINAFGEGKVATWILLDDKKTATVNGNSCYEVEIPDGYTGMNFVRQNPAGNRTDWSSKWNQTSNITIENNTLYTITNGYDTSSYSTATVNTYTTQFASNKDWSNVYAYTYGGETLGRWPGTKMTKTTKKVFANNNPSSSYFVYSLSFLGTGSDHIIFNNGDDPGVEGNTKTGNLEYTNGQFYTYGIENPNLAPFGTASASFDDANAYQSNDGNTDSRWGSNSGTDTEWYQIKWPIAQTFNTITIMYEGAMNSANAPSLEYIIQTSNDGENWTDRATCTTKLNGGEWLSIPLGENVTASYVRFQGVKRGNYGYSFWELGVYKLGEALALSSLQITPDKTDVILNSTASFTAVGKDQLGGIFNTGVLTWTSSDTSVGTVADGVFTAIAAGTTNVTASNSTSTVISNEVTMTAIDAVKIDLATNNDYRIYPIEETSNNGKINAFDSDLGSLWVLHGSTAADESSRTYNTGFIADLGGVYDITNISIKFEGACSKAFGLAFAGTDGVFGEDVYTGGHNDQETHTEEFSGQNVTNARYVKFLSTKATTQWGIKIMDFTIDGVEKSTVTDTTNPTITTVSEGTVTNNSITLNITGNDNDSKYLMYKVESSGKTSWISGAAGTETSANFEDLLPGKEYSFTITAYDSKGNNVNTNKVVSTTGDPLTLPVATKNTDDVKTIFGQYGKPIDYHVYRASEFAETGWGHNALQTNGDNNNVEMTFPAKDVSDMEYLHLDIYAPSAIPMCVFLQDGSWKGIDIEDGIPADEWKQVDIPMSFFKETCERPMTALTNLLICKKVDNTTTHSGHGYYSEPYPYFIIGNIYFWKSPAVDTEKPVMVSATLKGKTYDSATLTLNATDNSGKVKFHIVDATNGVDVTTDIANSGENFEYTVTELYDNTSYDFTVTAVDSKGNISDNSVVMSTITTDAAPSGQEKVKETHTVFLIPYHYVNTNVYELIITCEENLTGLGGAYWHTSAGDKALDLDYVINSDKKSMVIRTESTSNPNMYTPLYVKINGDEVSFDNSITWIEKHADAVSVTVNEWASFSSAKGLDFSNVVGLKAYKVTSNSNTSVSYTSVDEAAANTGLVLNGAQRTYYVPVKTTASSHNDNLLKGTATAAKIITADEAATNKFYAFGKKAGEIGFVKAAAGYTVHAGKAYLELTNALAANGREFIGLPGAEESETDGINKVNTLVENGVRYNLAGQRVGNDYKGIVIVNGRKVVIK